MSPRAPYPRAGFSILFALAVLGPWAKPRAWAQPSLRVSGTGTNVLLSWPHAQRGYQLEGIRTVPNPAGWTSVSNQPTTDGREASVQLAATNSSSFFRLHCPGYGPDVPDAEGLDTNCDGIDGDVTNAVFVAPGPFGSDTQPGTPQQPVATLPRAIQLAAAANPRRSVYAARGSYALTNPLLLQSGVSLYGQYDGTTNWGRSPANTTEIGGVTTAVVAENLNAETHVEGFTIRSSNASAAGGSSYAIRAVGGSGALVIRYCAIYAGRGAAGSAGASGAAGVAGSGGGNGGDGACNGNLPGGTGGVGGASAAGRIGGKGGNGGPAGVNPGQTGAQGAVGTPGGSGGAGGSTGDPGAKGNDGVSGTAGTNGAIGLDLGSAALGLYQPAQGNAGTPANPGNGGGGGGGGGGQGGALVVDGPGNGGGGGGGGGSGGAAGQAGGGGGGSFGVFIDQASVVITDNDIQTFAGGAGASGGNGGLSGSGGAGGLGGTICTGEVGAGGNGGRGGNGGPGGAGAGGAGGPSIGICAFNPVSLSQQRNSFLIGVGGAGGNGGTHPGGGTAPSGPPGLTAQSYTP